MEMMKRWIIQGDEEEVVNEKAEEEVEIQFSDRLQPGCILVKNLSSGEQLKAKQKMNMVKMVRKNSMSS